MRHGSSLFNIKIEKKMKNSNTVVCKDQSTLLFIHNLMRT